MITLTRLSGQEFVLNSDLIERVDCTPDSVVTLVDGTKYVVLESLAEIVAAVRRHRSEIIQAAWGGEGGDWITGAPANTRPLAPVAPLRGDR